MNQLPAAEGPGVEGPRDTRQKALLAAKVLLAVLAVALLVALALLRTWPPLNVVMSGSMEPAIEPGDVVVMKRLDRPAEVGDIVAIHPPQEIQRRLNYPETIIHRIVAIGPEGKVYTKGDARKERDPFTVQRDAIESHVVWTIPSAGRIVAFFTSPLGLIWLGLGALLFVLLPYLELRRDQIELERAELDSLAGMRMELQEVAQRVEGGYSDAGAAPPPLTPPVVQPLPGEPGAEPPTPPAGYRLPGATQPEAAAAESELGEMRETIEELVAAVGEYGEHLRSHTAVLQGMSAASQDLAAAVAALRALVPAAGTAPPATPLAAMPPAAEPPPAPPPSSAAPPPSATPQSEPPPVSNAERERHEAERFIRWQEQRATEIAVGMGFHDPLDAARRAPLDEAADDESIERKLWELAFRHPDLLGG